MFRFKDKQDHLMAELKFTKYPDLPDTHQYQHQILSMSQDVNSDHENIHMRV